MTDFLADGGHDAKLQYVIDNGTTAHLCFGDPANRAEVLTNSLGSYTPVYGAIGNGGAGIRRTVQVAEEDPVAITATGTYAHWCAISATELVAKTPPAAPVLVTNGENVKVLAVDIDSLDET